MAAEATDVIALPRSDVPDVSGNAREILLSQHWEGRDFGFGWREPKDKRDDDGSMHPCAEYSERFHKPEELAAALAN